MTKRIVMIDDRSWRFKCKGDSLRTLHNSEPVYEEVRTRREAWTEAKKFIGDVTLTTFWGTWENRRVLFLCHDMFTDDLQPNKQATIAYLGECVPGTMQVIFGPVVGLLDPELW